ncbi:MAG: hypothetical protein EA425_11980 [Puniceicoccaceae bacterium]|nr:MAG: hypothetical protein EA425_11980 [Puniceicoccaceae bacterium]
MPTRLSRPLIRVFRILLPLLLAALLGGGCRTFDRPPELVLGRGYHPENIFALGPPGPDLVRVGVLPIHAPGWEHADLAGHREVFLAELGKTHRFEVVPVDPELVRRITGQGAISSVERIPADFLHRLAEAGAFDGILFLEFTHLRPYPPLALGIRAKLVHVRNGEITWAFDSLFDAADPRVANAARRHALSAQRGKFPLDRSDTVLLSPRRFSSYVAAEVFSTIPLREPKVVLR